MGPNQIGVEQIQLQGIGPGRKIRILSVGKDPPAPHGGQGNEPFRPIIRRFALGLHKPLGAMSHPRMIQCRVVDNKVEHQFEARVLATLPKPG